MKISKLVLVICALMLCIPGCGDDDDDNGGVSDPFPCDCKFNDLAEENGILMIYEHHSVRKPANVSVLFKATDKIGGIPNLKAEDFKLFENNKFISAFESRQAILPKPGKFQSHILLLLDLSGSILHSNSLTALKEASQSFVLTILPPPDDANFGEADMSIMWFDGDPKLHMLVPFTNDAAVLISGIDSITEDISSDVSTNLYGAVIDGVGIARSVTGIIQNTVSVSSVVIFTDGTDQASRKRREDAVKAVENTGGHTSMYTIGLGGEIFESELIAFGRDGFVFANHISDLIPKFDEIANRIKDDVNSHYLLEYCSPKRDGSHILTISLTQKDVSGSLSVCFCAKGFEGGCKVE